MKKIFTLVLVIMVFAMSCIPWVANAQTTITIGTGTSSDYTFPFNNFYRNSWDEMIYPASSITETGNIVSIGFDVAAVPSSDYPFSTLTIYMGTTSDDVHASTSSWLPMYELTEVYSATNVSSPTAIGWMTIDLDTPFPYSGNENLVIVVSKTMANYTNALKFYYTAGTSGVSMHRRSDSDVSYADHPESNTGTFSTYLPNLKLTFTAGGVTCERPATMEASNVTANSAVLAWTGGSGTYNVEYKLASESEWTSFLTNTTATTTTLNGLNPNTAYQVRVQSVCGGDVSGWKNVSFSTPVGIPLIEAFGTSIPTGWGRDSALLRRVLDGTTEPMAYNGGWRFGASNGVFDNHAYVNIYGTNCKYWLVTPSLMMEDNVQLLFDVAYTAYSGQYTNTAVAPATGGTDDKFVVLINDGQTWSVLRQWDNAGSQYVLNNLGVTPTTVAIDLSSYAGQIISIAFYGESTESNAANNLHIDNVSINSNCAIPTGITVSDITPNSASVSWTGLGSAFNLQYKASNVDDWTEVNGLTGLSYNLTNLVSGTPYSVRVQQVCTENTSVLRTATFTTPEQTILSQVISLNSGTTWVSFNVEITLNELRAALVEAAPDAIINIYGQSNSTSYITGSGRWRGNLTWDVTKMYMIKVTTDCEITLEGMPINPADHPVTIENGNNFLGFPLNQSMTLTAAFAGFAANGDRVYSQTGSATYTRGRWQGNTLTELQPGKGYIYKSAASGSRTFVFPGSSR